MWYDSSTAQVDEKTFLDPNLRKKWIEDQLTTVRENYLDGLNFDYEGAIAENQTDLRDAYTALVKETRERFLQVFPHSLVRIVMLSEHLAISNSVIMPIHALPLLNWQFSGAILSYPSEFMRGLK